MLMPRSKKLPPGTKCVYCGTRDAVNMDHVVPTALFLQRAENPIKVPTCGICNNNKKSQLDVYLRDRLIVDSAVQTHPTAQEIFGDSFKRAVEGNHSVLTREFAATKRVADIFKGDRYVGRYVTFEANWSAIDMEMEYIARGLSYAYHESRIPDDYGFRVKHIPQFSAVETLEFVTTWPQRDVRTLGPRNEFVSIRSNVEGGHRSEAWCLIFYGAAVYVVTVHDPFTLGVLNAAAPLAEPHPILSQMVPAARPKEGGL
jgi:hypothetical protein